MDEQPGGGADSAPPSDLGRRTCGRRENLHSGRVRCKLQVCIAIFSFFSTFYFIWINYANLCVNSYFPYKSLIKALRVLIFGTFILLNILTYCALKNSIIEIYFLCILLFYEFLMYFFVFSTFCFLLFFHWNTLQQPFEALFSWNKSNSIIKCKNICSYVNYFQNQDLHWLCTQNHKIERFSGWHACIKSYVTS